MHIHTVRHMCMSNALTQIDLQPVFHLFEEIKPAGLYNH